MKIYFLAINFVSFMIYFLDKKLAIYGWFRVPEKTLLILGLLGGTVGACIAQKVFKHKTQKRSFQFAFKSITCLQILVIIYLYSNVFSDS
ncbi:DUF1294 domain-containing protein [bacterium]|nr:DUF1294 domain-containing protein [bacterium]